ncbi:hypothetical protein PRIPAC_76574, partial [Pristionchus pacificus]
LSVHCLCHNCTRSFFDCLRSRTSAQEYYIAPDFLAPSAFSAMFAAPTSISNYFKVFRIDDANVRSEPPYIGGVSVPDRLYGGLALSQAVQSLKLLSPDLVPHNAQYKFISPGFTNIPLEFNIRQFNGGKVVAIKVFQNKKLIGMAHFRCTRDHDHLDSSSFLCPDYGPHHHYPLVKQLSHIGQGHKFGFMQELAYFPMEIRPVETPLFPFIDGDRHSVWLRMKPKFHDTLKSTDGLHVLLFLSDFTMLQVGSETYQKRKIKLQMITSLHHSVWIHEANVDPLAWYLIVVECHVISHARAKTEAYIFNEDRRCVMSVVQEGYMFRAKEG